MAPPIYTNEAIMFETEFTEPGPDIELIMCVLAQLAQLGLEITSANRVYLLQALAEIPDIYLLELLPSDHPVYEGRRNPTPSSPLLFPSYDLDKDLHDLFVTQEPWHFN